MKGAVAHVGAGPGDPPTLTLSGQRVVVTRSTAQAGEITRLLRERGAAVLQVPCITIEPPSQHRPLVDALAGLGSYDWIVFTSVNGVESFFGYFFKAFEDLRDLGGVRFAAVGPATAAGLRALHLKVDLTPKDYAAPEIARCMTRYESLENLRILLLRAEVANPDLPRLLEDAGAIVDDIACYRTVGVTDDPTGDGQRLSENGADWITFTSGSTVEHFNRRFDLQALRQRFPSLGLASIGPETTQALAPLGLRPTVEARIHTVEGLVQALSTRRRSAAP